jgi:antitoxin VapB
MALNIKNKEVEQLAAEVAELAHESKTEAIRAALEERADRLRLHGRKNKIEQIEAILKGMRKKYPKADFGRTLSKEEEEAILGYGPHGV